LAEGKEEEEEDTVSWVQKSREKHQTMVLRQKQEETEKVSQREKRQKTVTYNMEHMKGLKVAHQVEEFKEGEERILTLKDTSIIDDKEDELVNIDLAQTKKLTKYLEAKKKRPGYNAYDEEEWEGANPYEKRSILSHYDEVLGTTQESPEEGFILNGSSTISLTNKPPPKSSHSFVSLKSPIAVSLTEDHRGGIMSDYYTQEDLCQFKKIKKKRTAKQRKENEPFSADSGEIKESHRSPLHEEIPLLKVEEKYQEEEEEELQAVLERARLLTQRKKEQEARSTFAQSGKSLSRILKYNRMQQRYMYICECLVRESRRREEDQTKPSCDRGSSLVISDTMEFVRGISHLSTTTDKMMEEEDDNDKKKSMEYSMTPSSQILGERHTAMQEKPLIAVDMSLKMISSLDEEGTSSSVKPSQEKKGDFNLLEEEPLVSSGMAATVNLLKKKGIIENPSDEALEAERRHAHRQQWLLDRQIKLSSETKAGGTITGGKKQKREKYSNTDDMIKRFEDYKPDINLTYTDEFGRQLNPKEAFKQLCFAFHGMGSGKNKTEKRLRKIREELLQQKLGSSDVSLNAMASLQKRMEQSKAAYVVLSSGNKA
jgi:U4/U6.U5 tri-snRNP-associated protein 1